MSILNADERAAFSALSDVLIPAAEGMPAASEIDIAGGALDRVLAARPDLLAALKRSVATGQVDPATDRIASLQTRDPEAFDALATAATGGYYTDERVRDLIGYPGQTYSPERLVDVISADDPMLQRVVARGPVFRPTPVATNAETRTS